MNNLEPSAGPSEAPEANRPAANARARPPFSWRAFFLGAALGVVAGAVGLVILVLGLALFVSKASIAALESPASLPAPDLPARTTLSIYGEATPTWTLKTLDGQPVPLGSYRGKVVFLNLWATWCAPCRQELATIEHLSQLVENDDKIAVLTVSDEDADTIRTFLSARKSRLSSLRTETAVPSVLQSPGIPSTFVINPDGLVVYRHVGMARWDTDTTVAFLRHLATGS
jgi:thiol-disulfide isomerase/thioredoxin